MSETKTDTTDMAEALRAEGIDPDEVARTEVSVNGTPVGNMLEVMTRMEDAAAALAPTSTVVQISGIARPVRRQKPRSIASAEGLENALQEKMFKLRKKISEEQVHELEAMDTERLHERIVESEVNLHDIEKRRSCDGDLASLKEKLKDASAPYREEKAAQTAIANYCACLLDQRGKA